MLVATFLCTVKYGYLYFNYLTGQAIFNYKITISKPKIKSYYFDSLFWSFGVVIYLGFAIWDLKFIKSTYR